MTTTVTIRYTAGEDELEFTWEISEEALEQVRFDFNPSSLTEVAICKLAGALALDVAARYGHDPRLTALAKTAFEEGSMWAVKSATAGI